MIDYRTNHYPTRDELLNLYDRVGWTAYTRQPNTLFAAVQNSLLVITAYEEDELVGLSRAVGDGQTIIYVQDILVLPEYRRQGIGKKLFEMLLAPYPNVRQKVLLTDDTADTRAFYKSMGFTACDNGQLVAFARMDV